jgi:hypothetical protein
MVLLLRKDKMKSRTFRFTGRGSAALHHASDLYVMRKNKMDGSISKKNNLIFKAGTLFIILFFLLLGVQKKPARSITLMEN